MTRRTRRGATPAVEPLVVAAYQHALQELAQADIPLCGACLEASVLMHQYLRDRDAPVQLVRRESEVGGHWTVRTPQAEYDPTIATWPDAPRSAQGLYVVEGDSPHHDWPETEVDVPKAYAVWFGE